MIRDAVRSASRLLGNTPAVCRRSYIHPAILRCFEEGVCPKPKRIAGLRARECATLSLLGTALAKAPASRPVQPRTALRRIIANGSDRIGATSIRA